MQHGKLVEHATTDEVFDHPQKEYTRDLLDAIPGGNLELGLDQSQDSYQCKLIDVDKSAGVRTSALLFYNAL